MKRLVILPLLINFIYAQEAKVINHQNYILTKEDYREYGEKGRLLHFYHDKNLKTPALTITLERSYGACGKKNYEDSSYKIEGSKLIYYSKWHGFSIDGYRKMVYNFKKNALHPTKESNILTLNNHSDDATLLEKKVKNQNEATRLATYIKSIQKRYDANFLLGDKAAMLAKEVEKARREAMQNSWAKSY